MGGVKTLQFYFDFSSPFAYLGATQVRSLAERAGARLDYRPFLLGALFRDIGTPNVPLFSMPKPKQDYVRLDLLRWADHWSVPLQWPSRFPMNTIKPLRMVLSLPVSSRPALIDRVFRAYWAEDCDISDDAVLRKLAAEVELDAGALLAATKDVGIKDALKAVTDEARSRGVCGAPTFAVGGDLYWGQDRIDLVQARLANT